MKKRFVSALLVLTLCLGILLPTTASAYNPTDDDIIDAVLVVFRCKEGTYDSVNRNDNGALSIGKLQWHGVRALELMKELCSRDPGLSQSLLGDSLYQEIVGAGSAAWNARTVSVGEASCLSALLATDLSRSVQDALARKDISQYIYHAKRLNIQDPAAIVYYCDLQNQYGPGGAEGLLNKVKALLGQNVILSLDDLHGNLLQVTGYYHERRNWVYQYCSSLDWLNLGAYDYTDTPIITVPVVDPNLDLQPPQITDARAIPLGPGVFQIEVRATDNVELKDCRVEVGSDVSSDAEFALYGKNLNGTWIARVVTDRFSDSAARYYVTVTAADTSANATSTRLEVARTALSQAHVSVSDSEHVHDFRPLFETGATALCAATRVEQCSECYCLRTTVLSPAEGIE